MHVVPGHAIEEADKWERACLAVSEIKQERLSSVVCD